MVFIALENIGYLLPGLAFAAAGAAMTARGRTTGPRGCLPCGDFCCASGQAKTRDEGCSRWHEETLGCPGGPCIRSCTCQSLTGCSAGGAAVAPGTPYTPAGGPGYGELMVISCRVEASSATAA